MNTIQVNKDLLSFKAVNQFTEAKVTGDDLNDLNAILNDEPDYDLRKHCEAEQMDELKTRYDKVRDIDKGIADGIIKDVAGATQKRKLLLSGVLNFMSRCGFVDDNILTKEEIPVTDIIRRYHLQLHSSEFVYNTVKQHQFIVTELNRLADSGEKYSSKNEREIDNTWIELQRVVNLKPMDAYQEWKVGGVVSPDTLYHRIKDLEKYDEYGEKYFPIENLCFLMKYTRYKTDTPKRFDWNIYRQLSQTSINRLLSLIVRLYKAEYKEDIAKYRADKNRDKKKTKRSNKNTKQLSATEKRNIVQDLKEQGCKYSEALKKSGLTATTFKRYW